MLTRAIQVRILEKIERNKVVVDPDKDLEEKKQPKRTPRGRS